MKTETRYQIHEAIKVKVGGSFYFVFLDVEIVVQEVAAKGGRTQRRRVTSEKISNAAILLAKSLA